MEQVSNVYVLYVVTHWWEAQRWEAKRSRKRDQLFVHPGEYSLYSDDRDDRCIF